MPFFSVILPIHNAATYMRKGLDTVKAQTFTDYELLIICDACDDNSAEIAREYTDKVFEINARTAGTARNVGLDNATGQWIIFMDDDDWWLHEYTFEMLAEKARNDNYNDIIAFSFIFKGQGYAKCNRWDAVWNKIWRRSFIESGPYRFPPLAFADDSKFSADTLPIAKIYFWDMPLYYYNYMREGSLSWRIENKEKF